MENSKQNSAVSRYEIEMANMNCDCFYGDCPDVHVLCLICNVGFSSTTGRDFHQLRNCSFMEHTCREPGTCRCLQENLANWEEERKKSRPDKVRLFSCSQKEMCGEMFETREEKKFHETHVCHETDFCCNIRNCDCFKKLIAFQN